MPARRHSSSAPDLRQRILDTARALLDEHGVAALSLREVARRAGVTHQAPYHHYADRESILAELVTQGFEELERRLARAHANAGEPAATLAASGLAYVGFALDNPGVFRIMFRTDLCDTARFPQAVAAGDRAHGELRHLVRLVHGGSDDPALASLHWAQVHGLASLLLDGPLGHRLPSRRERLACAREATALHARLVVGAPGASDRRRPRGQSPGASKP
jgi:AcrR family transcriptional regulator